MNISIACFQLDLNDFNSSKKKRVLYAHKTKLLQNLFRVFLKLNLFKLIEYSNTQIES